MHFYLSFLLVAVIAQHGLIPESLGITEDVEPIQTESSASPPPPAVVSFQQPLSYPELGKGGNQEPGNGTFVYCYPFTYDEVLDKCAQAAEQPGVKGLYLPLMMEIQQPHEPVYYSKVKELRKKTGLEVVGVAYENPRWKLINEILDQYPNVFSGVLLEWIGSRACVNQIFKPKPEHLEAIKKKTDRGYLRYFFRDQNMTLCDTEQPMFLGPQATFKGGALPFPEYITPVFACFGGQEGMCYKAITQYPELACNADIQRFSFNPYELGGGRLLHLMNETCHGIPSIDYYGTL